MTLISCGSGRNHFLPESKSRRGVLLHLPQHALFSAFGLKVQSALFQTSCSSQGVSVQTVEGPFTSPLALGG